MKSRRRWWVIYVVCALTLCAALAWISLTVLRLEKADFEARAQAEEQESIRLALWRMDSWIAPYLATEAARPYFEYQSFYPQQRAYTRLLSEIESGEVLAPSPLMVFESPYFRIHFQIGPDGNMTSPQAPAGDLRRLAEGQFLTAGQIDANAALLQKLTGIIAGTLPGVPSRDGRTDAVAEFSALGAQGLNEEKENLPAEQDAVVVAPEQQLKSEAEFDKRKNLFNKAASNTTRAGKLDRKPSELTLGDATVDALEDAPAPASAPTAAAMEKGVLQAEAQQEKALEEEALAKAAPKKATSNDEDRAVARVRRQLSVNEPVSIEIGPLEALWFTDRGEDIELLFHRSVVVDGRRYIQGVVCDWSHIRADMLAEVSDLLAGSGLDPAPSPDVANSAMMLASLPAVLAYTPGNGATLPVLSATRTAIALTWLAVLTALIAVAVTLASSIAFGERRSRFASAVTHELRTPLTSFRLYTEMLADGMVDDPDKSQRYLNTLKTESARLATLVENVLAYARLEEGRRPAERRDVSAEELLSHVSAALHQRAAEASISLDVDCSAAADARIRTDVEAVGQILFNLVDNACKYGKDGGSIEIAASQGGGQLHIDVQDHGAGIDAADERTIFSAFHRGHHENSEKPGIGLGLALSRGLARDLGGDLTLSANGGGGARFVLHLPLSV